MHCRCSNYGLRAAIVVCVLGLSRIVCQAQNPTLPPPSAQNPYAGVTREYAQNVIAGLQREIDRQKVRVDITYRIMWVNTANSSVDIFNVYPGQLFGRANVYEQFSQTIDEAQKQFRIGNSAAGIRQAYDALKQFKDLAKQANGIFNPVNFTEPPDPKDVLERLKQIRDDTSSLLKHLASTGDSMVALEENNKRLTELKRQLNDWQTVMANAPSQSKQQPKSVPFSSQPATSRAAQPTDNPVLDDAVLVNRWLDLGNRAFFNRTEEDAFYRRHPNTPNIARLLTIVRRLARWKATGQRRRRQPNLYPRQRQWLNEVRLVNAIGVSSLACRYAALGIVNSGPTHLHPEFVKAESSSSSIAAALDSFVWRGRVFLKPPRESFPNGYDRFAIPTHYRMGRLK
jgi:hypothetical protein